MQTIIIPTPAAVPWRGKPRLPAWADKPPAEVVSVALDLSRIAGAASITSVDVAVAPVGLAVADVAFTSAMVSMVLGGGIGGTDYVVSVAAQMSDGEYLVRDIALRVDGEGGTLAPATWSGGQIELEDGSGCLLLEDASGYLMLEA